MHLASLEQQRELMRYINSLNEWLGYGVEVRQTELRGVSARIDQLRDDLHSLDLTGGTCRLHRLCSCISLIDIQIHPSPVLQPGPGLEPGGFIVAGDPEAPGPPSPPSPLGLFEIPVRPGGGTYVPPPPQATFHQPTQQYVGVVSPVVPRGYGTPTASWSPPFL